MRPARPDLAPLVGTERVACGLRLVVGLVLLAMTLQFDPAASWAAVAAIVLAVGWSVLMFLALRSDLPEVHLERLAGWSYWFDIILALTIYAVFLSDPVATPVAGLPLFAYRVALRHGNAGIVVGAVGFVALVALRITYTRLTVGEGMVRPPMLLAWTLVAVVVLMLAREVHARQATPPTGTPGTTPPVGSAATAGAPAPTTLQPLAAEGPRTDGPEPATGDQRLDSLAADLMRLEDSAPSPLSRREVEVLVLLGQGLSYQAVATRLFISPGTVRNHVHNIRNKLEVPDRDQLLRLARAVASRTPDAGAAS